MLTRPSCAACDANRIFRSEPPIRHLTRTKTRAHYLAWITALRPLHWVPGSSLYTAQARPHGRIRQTAGVCVIGDAITTLCAITTMMPSPPCVADCTAFTYGA
jgi:hypothetical protein